MSDTKFGNSLDAWLRGGGKKTLQSLLDAFQEKSFAVLFLILMAVPALPLPTGGITHIFELITMLLCIELIAGRREVWLPRKWRNLPVGKNYQTKGIRTLGKIVRFAERYSKPRLRTLLTDRSALRLVGLVVLLLTIFAFLAPPFSGLDTVPALGVVFIALAMILEDALLALIGLIVGSAGIGLVLVLGRLAFKLL